jgi:hypothetical protein
VGLRRHCDRQSSAGLVGGQRDRRSMQLGMRQTVLARKNRILPTRRHGRPFRFGPIADRPAFTNWPGRADAIARRKAIYLELYPKTEAGTAGAEARWADGDDATRNLRTASFTEATSEATGKSRSTVERSAARGKALGDSLKDIAGTSLDSEVELDAPVRKPEAERADRASQTPRSEPLPALRTQDGKVAVDRGIGSAEPRRSSWGSLRSPGSRPADRVETGPARRKCAI